MTMLFTELNPETGLLTADKITLQLPGDGDSFDDEDEDDDWSDIDDEDFEDMAEDGDDLSQIMRDNDIVGPDDDDHFPEEDD
jgi:hypothetical protein